MAAGDGERGRDRPAREPLAIVAGPGTSVIVTHLDPLTLRREGPRRVLREFHDRYSFSPDKSAVAFGISAPPTGGGGRVGVQVVDTDDLNVSANIQTGVFGAALAWVEPRRLVALLGSSCSLNCPDPAGGRQLRAAVVDPVTSEQLALHGLPVGDARNRCGVEEARGEALLVLVGESLFVVRADQDLETVPLPPSFERCEDVVAAPGGETAFAVSDRGDLVAEVGLTDSSVEVHRIRGRASGTVKAIALDDRRLVLVRSGPNGEPRGVELLDLDRDRRQVVDPRAGNARVVGNTIITFGGEPAGSRGMGVRGYDRNGRREFGLLGGERIVTVEPFGRFAYAVNRSGFAIADVRAGAVVHRSSARPRQSQGFILQPGGQ